MSTRTLARPAGRPGAAAVRARRDLGWPPAVVALGVCAVLPTFVGSDYARSILSLIMIYAIASYGLDLVVGHLGLVSVAHAALLTVSAYTLSVLTTIHHWGYWLAALAAVVVTTAVGVLLAAITMRSKGHYFAVSSLAFAGAIVVVLTQWASVTRGGKGIYGIPAPPGFGTTVSLYYLGLAVLAAVVGLVWLLTRSRLGRSMRTIRTDEVLAASLGINVVATKLKAFAISAAVVGLAGPLYASWVSYIDPSGASILSGVQILVYVIVGGTATLLGPLLGTALVVGVTEAFSFTAVYQTLISSAAVFLVLMFFREGLAGGAARAWQLAMRRLPLPARAVPAPPALPGQGLSATDPPVSVSGPLLEAVQVSKRYGGVRAVTEVTLNAEPGEVVGVIGPNGAGKSTLFGLISGLVSCSGGEVRMAGRALHRLPAHARARLGIGRTFQTNRLLDQETVLDNLLAVRPPQHGRLRPARADAEHVGRLWAILDTAGLAARAHEQVSALSVEERKLVGVAMALALRPRVLLLDEPFAGLRESETPRLAGLLRTLSDGGLAILLVEHKMRVVMSLCRRVYVIDSGSLIAQGSPRQIAADPRVVKAYLGTAGDA